MVEKVNCCGPDDPLSQAAQIMMEHDCGWIPVVNRDSRVIGVLTDRDICIAAYMQRTTLGGVAVSSAMTHDVHACRPRDDLLTAQRMMRRHRVRRLPVADGEGRLVGAISLTDIARVMGRSGGGKAQVVRTLLAIGGSDYHERFADSQNRCREGGRRQFRAEPIQGRARCSNEEPSRDMVSRQ